MKHLYEGNSAKTEWNKQILADLSFIKKHLRYPMRRSRWIPILFWSLFFLLIAVLTIAATLSEEAKAKPVIYFAPVLFPLLILLRYIHSLRFVRVSTPFYLNENIQILERFLKSQQILTYRHPEAPEVFQILSKNISIGKEDREIMIFVADDKRILINSHFTNSGWSLSAGKSHVDAMANGLLKYIRSGTSPQFHQKLDA